MRPIVFSIVSLFALAALAGCAIDRHAPASFAAGVTAVPAYERYVFVTGSRVRHRVDAHGEAIAANYVQTITDQALQGAPGLTLAEKLSYIPDGL